MGIIRANRRRRVLVAMLVASLALAVGDVAPAAQAGIAARCAVSDTLTRYRDTTDWYRSVLDTGLMLRPSYAPKDLVPVARAGVSGGGYLRRVAIADFAAMYRAARGAGARFAVTSAYRSYATQRAVFWSWVRRSGYRQALLTSARPGHSEHQLGTTVDLMTPGAGDPWNQRDWGTSAAGAWLRRNSWRFGFVMSYPKSESPGRTCYAYEPWHFRYVGRSIAAQVHASELAPRDWLWLTGGTTTWSGGGPLPTPTPGPTATPSPSVDPTPTPTAEPTTEPSTEPTPTPTAEPSTEPTAAPAAVPTAPPTPEPAASLTAEPVTEPAPGATPEPTPGATPGATPAPRNSEPAPPPAEPSPTT